MITENLIDRLNAQAARHLIGKVRNGRRRALSSISKCCVFTTDDGTESREQFFDQPPTIGQLVARVGPDEWVVAIKMRRVPRQVRVAFGLAAE